MVGGPGPDVTGIVSTLEADYDNGAAKFVVEVKASSENQARRRSELELRMSEGLLQAMNNESFTAVSSEPLTTGGKSFINSYKVTLLNNEWIERYGPEP